MKHFQNETTYHLYNRGVAKSQIFLDEQDYEAFIRRLQLILLPANEAEKLQHSKNRIRLINYYDKVNLQAFCLMPNHFHFMMYQVKQTAITDFMRTLCTSYSMYFNIKYGRVGPLFQERFKAALVNSDSYLLHLSRYIHNNPLALNRDVYQYPFSSLQYYYQSHAPGWLKLKPVEDLFENPAEYRRFTQEMDKQLFETEDNFNLD